MCACFIDACVVFFVYFSPVFFVFFLSCIRCLLHSRVLQDADQTTQQKKLVLKLKTAGLIAHQLQPPTKNKKKKKKKKKGGEISNIMECLQGDLTRAQDL
jgi:hypothetical protein